MAYQSFQPLIGDGNVVEAKVKWFNTTKGFGFVALPDGSEAFLHMSALQSAGIAAPGEGATIKCEVGAGKKGPQVTRVVELVGSGGSAPAPSGNQGPRVHADQNLPPPAGTIDVEGSVKWFSVERGYGFVTMDDGGDDVFVQGDYVRRAGLQSLDTDQRVLVSVTTTAKGREARRIQLLDVAASDA
jgi:CspA family cold shock protein